MNRQFTVIVGNDDVTADEITEVLDHVSMQVIEVTEQPAEIA